LETQRDLKRLRKRSYIQKLQGRPQVEKINTVLCNHCALQSALTPDDVSLPGNIQAKDRIYPPVISLVSSYNAGDCRRAKKT